MFASKGLFRNVFFQPYNDRGGNVKLQNAAKGKPLALFIDRYTNQVYNLSITLAFGTFR